MFLKWLKERLVYIVTLLLVLAYISGLYILKNRGKIQEDTLALGMTAFVGWLVALLIAWIHLRKNRLDNLTLNKQETKKRLEIEAFRELNNAISKFSNTIGSVSVSYWTWPSKLELHRRNPSIFSFNRTEINPKISEQIIKLGYAEVDFLTAIEANEIVILQFDHLRKFIQFKIYDLKEAIESFRSYFSEVDDEYLAKSEGYSDFERRCKEINEQFIEIHCYLYDYRIQLMNSLLGGVFDTKVPERKPIDQRYKKLSEVAIKEEVEREFAERQKKIIREGELAG